MSETDRELVAEEVGEIEQRRLNDIFDTRKKVREAKSGLGEMARKERPTDYLSVYRSHVEAYLIEVEPLFVSTEKGKHVWNNADFGAVKIEPPIRYKSGSGFSGTPDHYVIEYEEDSQKMVWEKPDPKYAPLDGLSSILEYENPITASWEVTVTVRNGMRRSTERTETVSNSAFISQRALDGMVRSVNRYLSDLDIGIDLEEESEPMEL